MHIHLCCHHCGQKLRVSIEHRGKRLLSSVSFVSPASDTRSYHEEIALQGSVPTIVHGGRKASEPNPPDEIRRVVASERETRAPPSPPGLRR